MKNTIVALLIIPWILSSLAGARPLLDFQIRVEEDGKEICVINWRNATHYPSRVLVVEKFQPNGSLSLNLGNEVDSEAQRSGDWVTYTHILRMRALEHSIGDPGEQYIATFKTREFLLAGKSKIGSTTVFEPEEGIAIKFTVREDPQQPRQHFKTREEFYEYIRSQNSENFAIESPQED